MKYTRAIGASLAALLAVSAPLASAQLNREDVIAQWRAEEGGGQPGLLFGEDSGSFYLASHFRSSRPRSDVKSDLQGALMAGTLTQLIRADSGSLYLARTRTSDRPREAVKAAVAAAARDGTLNQLFGEDSGSFELASMRSMNASSLALKRSR